MQKKDAIISTTLGFLIGFFLFVIQLTGNIPYLSRIPYFYFLLFLFPVFSVAGVFFASFIGKKITVAFQGAKFLLVGASNFLVDLTVLNILIAFTGISTGMGFSLFKGISFIVAVTNSYIWNKHWTFHRQKMPDEHSAAETKKEFVEFFLISGVGFALNVTTASVVVNTIGPQFDISQETWATVGALAGTVIVLTWNFLGYKLVVFKKK